MRPLLEVPDAVGIVYHTTRFRLPFSINFSESMLAGHTRQNAILKLLASEPYALRVVGRPLFFPLLARNQAIFRCYSSRAAL
jgi:hypothetical protein